MRHPLPAILERGVQGTVITRGNGADQLRRRLAVWLVGSALIAASSWLVGCAVTATLAPVVPVTHPSYTPGTACDAANCHDQYRHKEPYTGPCETCHNLVNWKQVKYKHKDGSFDQGMHPIVGCATCHTEGEALPSPACSACHDAPHKGLQTCQTCHNPLAWHFFNALPEGHVPLNGGHSKLVCLDCHTAKTTPVPARTCVNCHGTNHGGLTQCYKCHTPAGNWKPKPGWDHSDFFKLIGKHLALYNAGKCASCHADDRFAGTPRVCVGCHGPHHGGLTNCAACHTPTRSSFKPATFRHSSVFALTGAHAKLKCTTCHPKKVFASAHAFGRTINHAHPTCGQCHLPHHGGLTQCGDCHTTAGFSHTTFKHSTVFVLIGAHKTLYDNGHCSACHPGNQYAVAPGTHCVDCHGSDSPHGSSVDHFNCSDCHTPAGANGFHSLLPFNDHPVALNAHHAANCGDCHISLHFDATLRPCVDCHAADVPHVGPSNCISCHTPTVWFDTHFIHPVIQGYPNTSPPHTSLDFGPYPSGCEGCHPGPDFTSHTCTTCHQYP